MTSFALTALLKTGLSGFALVEFLESRTLAKIQQ